MKFGTRARKELEANSNVNADKIIVRKDGTVAVRKVYFYRHGMDSAKWANRVLIALPYAEEVEHADYYRSWPKQSYFEVVIREKQTEAQTA
jgi:hypothetical protein